MTSEQMNFIHHAVALPPIRYRAIDNYELLRDKRTITHWPMLR